MVADALGETAGSDVAVNLKSYRILERTKNMFHSEQVETGNNVVRTLWFEPSLQGVVRLASTPDLEKLLNSDSLWALPSTQPMAGGGLSGTATG